MKNLLLLITLFLVKSIFAQLPNIQNESQQSFPINWSVNQTRAMGDSCGFYYNNYIGMSKTNIIRQEYMRFDAAGSYFNGRAQRFEAPQPIEVNGVEFYAFIDNTPSVTSVMVITMLNEYDAVKDSVGVEITRDTVYVTHAGNSALPPPALPNISVQSTFDQPITVTTDYIVSIFTPEDQPLIIIANDPNENAGNGENLSHALYSYTGFPTAPPGWYNMMDTYAADYDFLIAPLVKYDLNDQFVLSDDSICPGIAGNACVTYTQLPIFGNGQYNSNVSNSQSTIRWYWDDGTFNAGLTNACHTYQNSGSYNINLQDTIYKYDYNASYCLSNVSKTVVAMDTVVPDFTWTNQNVTVDFVSTSTHADSVWWDFGNDSIIGGVLNPAMVYDSVGTFEVWLHAINECTEDSIMYQVMTDDVGFNEFNQNNIVVYPNPASQNVMIKNLTFNSTIQIIDMSGKTLLTLKNNNDKQLVVNTSNFTEGNYIIRVSSPKNVSNHKLLIQH